MMALYGRQWEASYGLPGGSVYKEWNTGLSTLKPEQIKRGLAAVMLEGGEYPPNLIKFMRLCRQAAPAYHQTVRQALPRPKPHYSVMRIERAKQAALTGQDFDIIKPSARMVMDWTGDDEEVLYGLIEQWNPEDGHEGLNELIDGHRFSYGTHHATAGIADLLALDYGHMGKGTIKYVEPNV